MVLDFCLWGCLFFEFMFYQIIIQFVGCVYQIEGDDIFFVVVICNGVGLFYGCKDGVCGFCKSKLFEGVVVYGNYQFKVLLVEEEVVGFILICCVWFQIDCIVEVCMVFGVGEFLVLKLFICVLVILRFVFDVVVLIM